MSEKNHSIIFLWLAIFGLLLFLFFFPLPKHNAFWALLQDTGHMPLFGVISLLLLSIFARSSQWHINSRGRQYLAALFATLFISALVEITQGFIPGREVSFSDFYLGAAGGLSFLLGYSLFDNTLHSATSTPRKIIIFVTSFSLLLAGIYPLLTLTTAYVNKRHAFPTLLTFEQAWPTPFLTTRENQYAQDKSEPHTQNAPPGYYRFTPAATAGWPFLRLDEVIEDWSAYQTIQFDFISSAHEPLPITILLDDQHTRLNGQHSQQFRRLLSPGLNHLSLPVSATAPLRSPKPMDLRHMASIWIAFPKPRNKLRPTGDILIGEVRLH